MRCLLCQDFLLGLNVHLHVFHRPALILVSTTMFDSRTLVRFWSFILKTPFFKQKLYGKIQTIKQKSQNFTDLIMGSIQEPCPANLCSVCPETSQGWVAKGAQGNHQGMENSNEHRSKLCFLSCESTSSLPSPHTYVPLSIIFTFSSFPRSIPFLLFLPLSFKSKPYSGSESEVGQNQNQK